MPKQKGLYQLQGKAQGMCYYSQAGVRLPLMRTINQGMSERVKTSEEFENTRKNNWEFALANSMATSLYNFIYPNWRSMFRRFTIPYMTARLLEEIKNGTGDWGERHLDKSTAIVFTPLINNYAKARSYGCQFGEVSSLSASFTIEQLSTFQYQRIKIGITQSEVTRLYSQGYGGVLVWFRYMICTNQYYYDGITTDPEELILSPDPSHTYTEILSPELEGIEFHMSINEVGVRLGAQTSGVLTSAVLLPYRWSGKERVIMQKDCTYIVVGIDPKPQTQS